MTTRALLLVALAAVVAKPGMCQQHRWEAQAARTEAVNSTVALLRADLQAKSPATVRKLDASIMLDVSVSGGNVPRSRRTFSGRTIEIPDLFIATSINLARALRTARRAEDYTCIYQYKQHMDRTGSTVGPETYLERAGTQCAELKSRFPLGPVSERIAEQELISTIAFAYLHELGHQYHEHLPVQLPPDVSSKENQCSFLRGMAVRRQLEYEADQFAVDTLDALGRPELVLATSPLWIPAPPSAAPNLVALDQMLSERIAEHPFSAFRWARILDRTLVNLSKRSTPDPALRDIIEQLKDWEARAREMVAESDQSLSPC
ncbi:hypothetical protein [Chitinimonas sp.]|uniref:hypothetical protein n=1 Tax=Chitinimonas sp. TaxID=1934313 RepID=UPI0035AFA72B